MIHIPTIGEQKKILKALERLTTDTKHLEDIYQGKLNLFTELKQSILQKAFTGQLTADRDSVDQALSEAGV